MKKIFFAALFVPMIAFAQSFPSPTFNSLTLQNPLSAANGGTGSTSSTGTGSAVLSNSPVLITPNLGTPSSVTLTNGTGLPIATGVAGLGTGVAAGLANAVTGSGAPVLGTSPTIASPSISGGSINNASVGATTASTGAFTALSASGTVSGTGFSSYLASPPAIGGTTPAAASFTGMNAAYQATYAPGTRAPLFIWQNPNGSTAAGHNSGQQIWIGNNPTATPAANDTVASTMAVTNGNNRFNLWAQNLLVGLCGSAEGCSTSDYVNGPVTGQEIDVYGSASWTPTNRAFNATVGTYPIEGQQVYCQGPQYCTAAYSAWSTASNGSNWWKEGIALNRIADIGLHFVVTPGDTGTSFGTASVQDDSNSANVIQVGSGSHTNYFNAPNFVLNSSGNAIFGAAPEVLGANHYAVIGGSGAGTSAIELNSNGGLGLYCATDGSTYGECMTHNSASLLLGSNNAAQLTLTTTGVTASQPITPSAGIVGVTTNSNASAGNVGEYVSATGTAVSMTNATPVNITSISLTAGDWDVSGGIQWNPAGTTTISILRASTSATSATNGTFDATVLLAPANGFFTGQVEITPIPTTRYSLASATTIYLVGTPTFGTSTMTASGVIRARRVR